ncbi:MAG: hypothetical protein ACJ76I_11940 [Gaiellaceae bacterium]
MICVVGFAAGAAVAGSSERWATVAQVKRTLLENPLDVQLCVSDCGAVDDVTTGEWLTFPVDVIGATVKGRGPSRLVNGAKRYQRFEARVCAIYYQAGGLHVQAHLLWHTSSPPTGMKTVTINGKTYTIDNTHGTAAYASDAEHPVLAPPLAHRGC